MKFKTGDYIAVAPEHGLQRRTIQIKLAADEQYLLSTDGMTRLFPSPEIDRLCILVAEPNEALKELLNV